MKNRQIALVTGATSGIGKAYAACFARMGYDLMVTGRRMDKLEQICSELSVSFGIRAEAIKAELSEEEDMGRLLEEIQHRDNIAVLVNNAGFGSGVEFSRNNLEEHLKMLDVHVRASVRLVYAVLPQMMIRKEGVIINVSSLGAYMPAPGSSMYSATKLFLASFTESLHMEVRRYGIKARCICPGFTHTEFHERRKEGKINKAGKFMWMEAEDVVKISVRSLKRNKVVVVPGTINRLLIALTGLMPRRLYYFIMERSGKVKVGPGFFDRLKQLIEKPVSFFFATHADQV